MIIFAGSKNPVKVNAVISAASETWPDVTVTGIDVASGINEQPLSDEETYQGAVNRAKAALAAGQQTQPTGVAIGVGLEGGVFEHADGNLWSTVWVVVYDGKQIFATNGARFRVPPVIGELIRQGKEMGPVVEQLVGEADVRSKQGMIGVITKGFVDRTEEYTGICKMALGLYYGQGWDQELKTT